MRRALKQHTGSSNGTLHSWENLAIMDISEKVVTVNGGSSIGKCGRLNQSSWLLVRTKI